MGRPSKFKEAFIEQAKNYCQLGATDAELATFFKVNVDTIYEWKKVHPTFSEATKIGKQESNERVKNSLYMKAIGFEHDDKYYPPDTTSIIFWLKNRDPDNWKDVKERVNLNIPVDTEDDSMLESARRIAFVIQQALQAEKSTPTQH